MEQTKAAPPKTLERIPKVIEELNKKNPNIKQWGILGYCWYTLPYTCDAMTEMLMFTLGEERS